jgi:hypothetical protein
MTQTPIFTDPWGCQCGSTIFGLIKMDLPQIVGKCVKCGTCYRWDNVTFDSIFEGGGMRYHTIKTYADKKENGKDDQE